MADLKYGRIFTQADVEKILARYDPEFESGDTELADLLSDMDESGVRFKWDPDEPVFALRGRDSRALGAIRHYRQIQRPDAPANHCRNIDDAVHAFDDYKIAHPELIKDPD